IDQITKFQDWSDYISDFRSKLSTKYSFDNDFFVVEFSTIIRDKVVSNEGFNSARSNYFIDPAFLAFLQKLVECTNKCGNEAKDISSGDGSIEDETFQKAWQAGCIRGCVIYNGL
ncbi:MAG: hypothetical protein ACKOE6_03600, partial [Flammeovirgaceae bacterium]